MIEPAAFWGALVLGGIIGGAAVELFRIFRPHRAAYEVLIYDRPGPAEPIFTAESTALSDVLFRYNQAQSWPRTHHILLMAPYGDVTMWSNPAWVAPDNVR